MKIYELAKELGISTKEVLGLVAKFSADRPKSHFQAVSIDIADSIRRCVLRTALDGSAGEKKAVSEGSSPAVTAKAKKDQVIVRRSRTKQEIARTLKRASPNAKHEGKELQLPDTLLGEKIKE